MKFPAMIIEVPHQRETSGWIAWNKDRLEAAAMDAVSDNSEIPGIDDVDPDDPKYSDKINDIIDAYWDDEENCLDALFHDLHCGYVIDNLSAYIDFLPYSNHQYIRVIEIAKKLYKELDGFWYNKKRSAHLSS